MNRDLSAYENEYNALPFEAEQAYLRRLSVLKTLNDLKPSSVLEVGCGMNPIFNDFQDFESMVVVEPGEVFSDVAEKKAKEKNLDSVRVVSGYLEELENGEYDFDVILLVSLLHEVPDPVSFLMKAVELGNTRTKYIINVPNSRSFHRQLAVKLGLIKSEEELSNQQKVLQQNKIFNRDTLSELLGSVGLKVVDTETMIFKPFTHGQMQKMLDHEILTQEQMHRFCSMMELIDPDSGSELLVIAEKK